MKLKENWAVDMSDQELIDYSTELFEFMSGHLDDEDIEVLNELLEVERVLTLQEGM